MTPRDVYLLSPELALVGIALAIVLFDLFTSNKKILAVMSVIALSIPFILSIILWMDIDSSTQNAFLGMFGTFTVDKFSLFFKFIVLAVVGLVVIASIDYVKQLERYRGEYYALIMFSATGMMLLAATRELITIYISLELTAIPIAALIALTMTSRSSEAAIKFLILSAISSATLLFGMTLVFGITGTTYLTGIAESINLLGATGEPFKSYGLLMAIVLIVAGLGFKVSSVPFHMWAPDVYEGGPTPVIAYLSVASKAAGFAILIRIFYTAFPVLNLEWGILFGLLSVASMTVGNVLAMVQSNVKRLLGYSTIAHAGYLLMGLAAVQSGAIATTSENTFGPSSLLFYLAAYTATNLAAFFSIIVITNKIGSDQIADFDGMGRRSPLLALVLTLAMISLIGMPPTGIFIAKVFIFSAAVKSGLTWLAIIAGINSVLSAYYYLRIVKVMYLSKAPSDESIPCSNSAKLALSITTVGILLTGIMPGPILRISEIAIVTIIS